MRRALLTTQGVSLLEVMLVLVIASMVLVAGIRYYKNASEAQNVNIMMSQIQTLTTMADRMAVSTGSYATVITKSNILGMGGPMGMTAPYNQSQYWPLNAPTATSYSIQIGCIPPNVCNLLVTKLSSLPKFVSPYCLGGGAGTCGATLQWTYDNTK